MNIVFPQQEDYGGQPGYVPLVNQGAEDEEGDHPVNDENGFGEGKICLFIHEVVGRQTGIYTTASEQISQVVNSN